MNVKERKCLFLRLLIKEIIFTKGRILIDFFEVPSVEEIIKSSSDPISFHQCMEWLPGQGSNLRHGGYKLTLITQRVGLYLYHILFGLR